MSQRLFWNRKWLFVWPAQTLPGQAHLFLTQGLAVRSGCSRLVGAAIAYSGPAYYQAGMLCFRLSQAYRLFYTGCIHAINGTEDMPAICLKTLSHVLGKGNTGIPFNGDIIVIIQIDKLTQTKCPCQ